MLLSEQGSNKNSLTDFHDTCTEERSENTPVRFGLNLDEGTDAFFRGNERQLMYLRGWYLRVSTV